MKNFSMYQIEDKIRKVKVEDMKRPHITTNLEKFIAGGSFVILLAGILFITMQRHNTNEGIHFFLIYGYLMMIYLTIKVGISFLYKPIKQDAPNLKVTAIIPSYNEDEEAVFRIVVSLLNQTYPIDEIYFVDDGSKDTVSYEGMKQLKEYLDTTQSTLLLKQRPHFIVHRLEKNKGKRFAQAYGIERTDSDVILTLDSDGILYENAIEELVKPLSDSSVVAVTGHINALNRNTNLFTRLLDMRYDNAFRIERSSQSMTGHVLCCSGPISMYRTSVIQPLIEQYKHQFFLGKEVAVGDDRALTNLCIPFGKTVYQSTAQCNTNVPVKYRNWVKQQVRWNKSFFRESVIALKQWKSNSFVAIWTISELFIWMFFIITLFTQFIFNKNINSTDIFYYIVMICLSAYARNIFYVMKNPLTYLCAPIYGFIHLFTINFVKIYSLATIQVNKWGTR